MSDTDEIKELRRSNRAWEGFIRDSLKRPKPGQWQDMCLAPVNTLVQVYIKPGYIMYAICVDRKRWFDRGSEYDWHEARFMSCGTLFIHDGIINPYWWQHVPMLPPLKPGEESHE